MRMDWRVALLATSFGSGHIKAARAVEQAVTARNKVVRTLFIDSFIASAPILTKVIINLYLRILSYMPSLYGYVYAWGNRSHVALWGRKLISLRLAFSTCSQLTAFAPQAVICTHASPAGAVSRLKNQGLLTAPLIAVITDFVVHRLWIFDEVDIFAVAHEKTAGQLLAAGVAPERIRITGIPIDEKFCGDIDKGLIRRKLGLDHDMPVVLIMGGGTGALPMDKIAEEFSQYAMPVQILAVAGQNEALRLRLHRLSHDLPVSVFGFVDNVHELMAAADLIITKPGGLSVAESLAMGIPMLLFRPIPGQEEGNAQFLIEEGAACRIDELSDLPHIIMRLLQDRAQLDTMRSKARKLAKPHAAQKVAEIVKDLTEKKSR